MRVLTNHATRNIAIGLNIVGGVEDLIKSDVLVSAGRHIAKNAFDLVLCPHVVRALNRLLALRRR